jgi:uncharacterized membrane protein YtjA (UPF0391 family)
LEDPCQPILLATPVGMTHALPDSAVDGGASRGGSTNGSQTKGDSMIYYALVFLIVGLVAGALGLFGIAHIAGQISWVLFLVGIVLLVIHLATGRRVPLR